MEAIFVDEATLDYSQWALLVKNFNATSGNKPQKKRIGAENAIF